MRKVSPLVPPGAVLVVSLGGAAALGDGVSRFPALLLWLLPATAAWWFASARVIRGDVRGLGGFASVFAIAAVMRGLWLFPEPPLSDDLYRYLWDGRVANAGVHPFEHAPVAPELESLRDDSVWPLINHPEVPTIYPPVAQLYFRALDWLAPTPAGARAGAVLLDLVTVGLLGLLLRARGRPAAGALVLGWCPLAVLETAGGGHLDSLGVALLVAGLLVLERSTRRAGAVSGGLLGLSVMVKPTALVLVPGLLWRGSWERRIALVAGALAASLVALPYLGAGAKLFTGFLTYAEHWRFNDSLFSLLVNAGLSPRGARGVLSGMVLLIALIAPWRVRDPLAFAGCIIGAGIVLSPTVHPWYALWLVPFVPFLPARLRPAALGLLAVLPLSYAAAWTEAVTGSWAEPGWLRPAVWIPVLVLLVGGVFRTRTGRAA